MRCMRRDDNTHIGVHRDGLASDRHDRLASNDSDDLLAFVRMSGTTSPGSWNVTQTDIERAPTSRLTTLDKDGCPEAE